MAFTIEDGAGVTGANSYVDLAEFLTYREDRGVTLSSADTDAKIQAILVKSCDGLEAFYDRYSGTKGSATQGREWPREGATINGVFPIGDDEIPINLKYAQMEGAIEVDSGNELQATIDSVSIKRDKVGPLETEFFQGSGASGTFTSGGQVFTKILDWLTPLFKKNTTGIFERA